MMQVISALYAEGPDDENFFGTLLPRVIRHEASQIDGLPLITSVGPEIVRVEDESNRSNAILTAARKTKGRHLLFIHSDADARKDKTAREQRIDPGLRAIAEHVSKAQGGAHLPAPVSIVPLQATEAWILADRERLADELGINEEEIRTIIGGNPERIARPKETLNEIRRRAKALIGNQTFFQTLGQRVRIEKLQVLKSYKAFRRELRDTLVDLFP